MNVTTIEELYKYLLKYFEVRKWIGKDELDQEDRGRLRALHLYIEFTGLNPKKLIKEWMTYCKKSRDDITLINHTKQQIIEFRDHLINDLDNISKNSAITYTATIMGFYSTVTDMQVRFTKQEKRIFRRNKGKKRKVPLSPDLVLLWINAMKFFRDKAIALCLKSSGVPIGDLLEMRFQDLEFLEEEGIYFVDFTRIKNDIRYITFFDQEAAKYLNLYLQSEYPTIQKPKDFVFIALRNAHEKQQLTPVAVRRAFQTAARKVQLMGVSPYNFRRFFTSQMKAAGMNQLHIDFMTGHITKAVQAAYDDFINSPRRLLLPQYLKYIPALVIFGTQTGTAVAEA